MLRLALWACLVGISIGSCKDQESGLGDGGSPTEAGAADGAGLCDLPHPSGDSAIPPAPVRKLDVLFMIDNSGGMREPQDELRGNFKALTEALRQITGGLPDMHIGVISSDLGAGNVLIPGNPSCNRPGGGGDRGRLQAKTGCGLDEGASFISVSDGGTSKNFKGEVENVFACIADLGTNGCIFEHQLQSVRLALSGTTLAHNPGFLRPDAQLSIIMLTDDDDCSAPFETGFFVDTSIEAYGSFRCNLAGHLCNGEPIPTTFFSTPLRNCTVKEEGPLIPVGEIAAFVKALKPEGDVTVSLIAGMPLDPNTARYQTGPGFLFPDPAIQPICESRLGTASPALRLQAFVNAFGENGAVENICSGDFGPALARIGARVANRLVAGCLPGEGGR